MGQLQYRGRQNLDQAQTQRSILVHDGVGIWLAARRLNRGRFVWPRGDCANVELSPEQLQALVLGLPWHRIGPGGVIDVL